MPLIVAEEYPENFGPLTLTRATFELRYGALCPLERALQITNDIVLQCRPELADYLRAKYNLPVNTGASGDLFQGLPAYTPWEILAQSDVLITADFENWSRTHANYCVTGIMPGAHIVGDASYIHVGEGAVVQPGCVLDVSNGPIIIDARAVI
ncbi:MAG TPA: hypothetical protein VF719_02415, partial [Abditibacteriaceae bacterium]